ncbi:MAG TPA: Holliday junction branch migration protein RuvA [Clostridia bacterium]|nr:Holliday junction branch migration protein RuvA [Clostridia bacterium]
MIGYLQGILQEIEGESILINVGGVGYQVLLPANALISLPAVGSKIELYTHLEVREDSVALYGFVNKEDLQLYKKLLTISGIGPKGALNIIGSIDQNRFVYSIINEDLNYLTKLPGVGKKTAQRLILELKDKLSCPADAAFRPPGTEEQGANISDAILGLQSLGYQKQEVWPFLTRGLEVLGREASPQELIRFVLKETAKARRG